MDKILGVRFRKTGKLVYMNPKDNELKIGDTVFAETEKGQELGRVVKLFNKSEIAENSEIINIIRVANKFDLITQKKNEEDAANVLDFAKKQANKLNLKMKFLLAEYAFDKSKITMFFTAEDRVDFRDLVKIIASEVKTRIELRQIGPRDEIKVYPNLGMCGREVCCRTHLQDFKSVTIKDAKEQGLQINMAKLSGACGRLMCCLKYEEESYKENLKKLPKYGDTVTVKQSKEVGKVCNVDILQLKVRVKFGDSRENEKYENYDADELTWNLK
ncbi:MAG: regulatory iron-sulfur-containing complex subunit RicT [Clostridia bacterium]